MITVGIDEQLRMLDKLMDRAADSYEKGPEGYVNVVRSSGRTQYYFKNSPGERHGKYIPKADLGLAKALVQKEYDRDFLAAAEDVRQKLLSIKKDRAERSVSFLYTALAGVYERVVEGRRRLITPYVLPDREFVKEWESVEYQGLSFFEDSLEFFTGRGERVRSKSEILIADKLNTMGIPYRYEQPLFLGRRKPIYPDFTLLDIRERKTVLYEHFGKMQDEGYARDSIDKVREYEKAGYRMGINFLFTMESSDCPLDIRMVERMIKSRFLE